MKHKFYAVFEVKDPIQMKTFGDREDIAKAKERLELLWQAQR